MNRYKEMFVKVVELKGDAYSIGVKQGREIRDSHLSNQLEQLREMVVDVNSETAKVSLKRFSPTLLNELEGIAESMEMNPDEAVRLYSGYNLAFPSMGCTALMQNGYYVRNYDFSPELYDARLVFTQPQDGYSSVGFSQQVVGRLDGMNEKGLVVGFHFVNSNHRGEGFMATTIVRMLLDNCANVEEATSLIKSIPHGYCYNYSMTDSSRRAVIVEASPERLVTKVKNPLICTNHFGSAELMGMNRDVIESSKERMLHVSGLLNKDVTALSAYQHFNDADSPLFYHDYKNYFGTLHTVVYSPNDLSLLIGIGGNCEPIPLSLKEYLKGEAEFPDFLSGMILNEV